MVYNPTAGSYKLESFKLQDTVNAQADYEIDQLGNCITLRITGKVVNIENGNLHVLAKVVEPNLLRNSILLIRPDQVTDRVPYDTDHKATYADHQLCSSRLQAWQSSLAKAVTVCHDHGHRGDSATLAEIAEFLLKADVNMLSAKADLDWLEQHARVIIHTSPLQCMEHSVAANKPWPLGFRNMIRAARDAIRNSTRQ